MTLGGGIINPGGGGGGAGIDINAPHQWVTLTAYAIGNVVWLAADNKIYRTTTANSDAVFTPAKWQELSPGGGDVIKVDQQDLQTGATQFMDSVAFDANLDRGPWRFAGRAVSNVAGTMTLALRLNGNIAIVTRSAFFWSAVTHAVAGGTSPVIGQTGAINDAIDFEVVINDAKALTVTVPQRFVHITAEMNAPSVGLQTIESGFIITTPAANIKLTSIGMDSGVASGLRNDSNFKLTRVSS